ncbi:MAG: hypothetical protein H6834_07095 [Planctomycetes bacterium]|nr:hypothetical protein [Planctomycetota bacterium]MCB9891563.1 hypothetical protein [Planctomycetota bacterium]
MYRGRCLLQAAGRFRPVPAHALDGVLLYAVQALITRLRVQIPDLEWTRLEVSEHGATVNVAAEATLQRFLRKHFEVCLEARFAWETKEEPHAPARDDHRAPARDVHRAPARDDHRAPALGIVLSGTCSYTLSARALAALGITTDTFERRLTDEVREVIDRLAQSLDAVSES